MPKELVTEKSVPGLVVPIPTRPLPLTISAGVVVPLSPIHKGYVEVPISIANCAAEAATEGTEVVASPNNPTELSQKRLAEELNDPDVANCNCPSAPVADPHPPSSPRQITVPLLSVVNVPPLESPEQSRSVNVIGLMNLAPPATCRPPAMVNPPLKDEEAVPVTRRLPPSTRSPPAVAAPLIVEVAEVEVA